MSSIVPLLLSVDLSEQRPYPSGDPPNDCIDGGRPDTVANLPEGFQMSFEDDHDLPRFGKRDDDLIG